MYRNCERSFYGCEVYFMKQIKAILLSVGITALVSAAFLALIALITAKTGSLPKSSLSILTTGAGCVAVCTGSFFASLYRKEKGIILGLICGACFLLCVGCVSIFALQVSPGIGSLGKSAAVLLSGSIGGILGVNRKSKVKF